VKNREQLEFEIRKLIAVRMDGAPDPASLAADVPIFSRGLGLDSIGAVELLTEIESRHGLRIDDDAFDIFDSLTQLVDYVFEHQNTASPNADAPAE
jgi:acyl carrier protein